MDTTLTWPGFAGISVSALLLLVLAAFVAGAVDAVVGGGGLIQLPALLLLLPGASVLAVATNKVSSVVGTSAATITYARRTPMDWRAAGLMAAAAAAGSVGGAAFATALPATALNVVVLVAIVVVGAYTLARPSLGVEENHRFHGRARVVAMMVAGALIGAYDGLAGPGTGSFLVFVLVGWIGYAFLAASATAKLANVATNLGALAYFAPHGLVVWGVGGCMAVGNLAGATLGARLAIKLGSAFVRRVFLVVAGLLALSLSWKIAGSF
ncbi:TSUP family transporter [Rhodococcus sp. X156]|uniref:sulfite exporter TauE/SafE family protein n=1 Tax=Rhodococcus sp. X156 TaxID=2499145 RepID=UPI001F49FAA9|nr:TSUP family transporter [Rhodococcus sp. X156]